MDSKNPSKPSKPHLDLNRIREDLAAEREADRLARQSVIAAAAETAPAPKSATQASEKSVTTSLPVEPSRSLSERVRPAIDAGRVKLNELGKKTAPLWPWVAARTQALMAFVATGWNRSLAFIKAAYVRVSTSVRSIANLGTKRTRVYALAGAALVVVGLVIFLLIKFHFVTVTQGIETTAGAAAGKVVLVDALSNPKQGDLILGNIASGVMGTPEKTVMGTVFTSNAETYAVYDGKVIWQLPKSKLVGKVMFLEPTQKP